MIRVLPCQPRPDHIPACFLKALRGSLEQSLANVWLKEVRLEKQDEAWVLTTTSSFKADYIRAHFSQALERAAEHVGLAQQARRPHAQV